MEPGGVNFFLVVLWMCVGGGCAKEEASVCGGVAVSHCTAGE